VIEPLVFAGPEGAITVTASALAQLVAGMAETVEGARVRRPRRTVELAHGDGRASVTVELSVEHGVPLPGVARSVQERVAEAVVAVSGLEVGGVDVEIAEVA